MDETKLSKAVQAIGKDGARELWKAFAGERASLLDERETLFDRDQLDPVKLASIKGKLGLIKEIEDAIMREYKS